MMETRYTEPIETKRGKVRGYYQDDQVMVFKGIPYAAPPVGEKRWKEAEPHPAWDGVMDCVAFGRSAPQNQMDEYSQMIWTKEFQIQNREYSEDCLTLNIWTAAGGSNMPVVVYFYGGGYVSGGSSCEIYDGTELVRNGVVYVTFNHREGTLALMATRELSESSDTGRSGNYMLSDDIAVLRWVRENIRAFGGDPDRVTIWGQSSGAGQVNALSISPIARSLFSQVISMGYNNYVERCFALPWMPLDMAYQKGDEFLSRLGCSLDEARTRPFADFLKLPHIGVIQIDGYYLCSDFYTGINEGRAQGIPFMMGAVPGDAVMMPFIRALNRSTDREVLDRVLLQFFGEKGSEAISAAYDLPDRDAAQVIQDLKDDIPMAAMLAFAEGRSRTGDADKTYIYYFTHAMPGPHRQLFGAFHSCEVPYFMNHFSPLRQEYWSQEDFDLGKIASAELISFIKTGRPRSEDYLPSDGSRYCRIDVPAPQNCSLDPDKKALWFSIFDSWRAE